MSKLLEESMEVMEPPAIKVQVGGCVYLVGIHFSETATATMSDKINRLIKRDIIEDAACAG